MSSNWKQIWIETLTAGKQPTYDQLEQALSGAMTERNAMEKTVCDMGVWLGKMVAAYLDGDDTLLPEVMAQFIVMRAKVKVAAPESPTTH